MTDTPCGRHRITSRWQSRRLQLALAEHSAQPDDGLGNACGHAQGLINLLSAAGRQGIGHLARGVQSRPRTVILASNIGRLLRTGWAGPRYSARVSRPKGACHERLDRAARRGEADLRSLCRRCLHSPISAKGRGKQGQAASLERRGREASPELGKSGRRSVKPLRDARSLLAGRLGRCATLGS